MIPENFGKNLAKTLDFLGMSQQELCRKTGLTQAAVSHIMNGKRDPAISTICKILNVIPVSFEKLCGPVK